MTQSVLFDTRYGAGAAENYARYFVPMIAAPLAADLLEAAALRPGEHVIDVACGTGVVTRRAAARVGVGGRVVGVDPNPAMLEVAAAEPGPPGAVIEWRQGRAEELPLPDQTFNFALCQLGVMFFSDRVAGLREIRRVLAPGGRLALNAPGRMPDLFRVFADALGRYVSPDAARFVSGVFSLDDAGEVERLLTSAGFGQIEVDSVATTLRLPAPQDFLWKYVHSTPLGAVVARVDDDARAELEREVFARWERFVEDGLLTLQLPVTTAVAQS